MSHWVQLCFKTRSFTKEKKRKEETGKNKNKNWRKWKSSFSLLSVSFALRMWQSLASRSPNLFPLP